MSGLQHQQKKVVPEPTPKPTREPVSEAPDRDPAPEPQSSQTPWLDGVTPEQPDSGGDAAVEHLAKEAFERLGEMRTTWLGQRHVLADADTIKMELKGRDPKQLQAIRAHFEAQTGHRLEDAVASTFPTTDSSEILAALYPGIPLREKLDHYPSSGGMENLLAAATPAELETLRSDPSALDVLRAKMDSAAFFEARLQLHPEQREQAVLERILSTNHYVDDDEGAAMAAFQRLTLEERRALLSEHEADLGFLGHATLDRMREMAVSEARALEMRLYEAVAGRGTDDPALEPLAEDVRTLAAEQARLEASLSAGNLSTAEAAKAKARLAELGDVRGMIAPQRTENGDFLPSSFLAAWQGDVNRHTLYSHMEQMGMSGFDIAKQRVLDAVGVWDDERGIQEAFAKVPLAERAALWDDPHIQRALTHLNPEEQVAVEAFRDNDMLKMTQVRVEASLGWLDDDEAQMFGAVLDLNAEDRAAYRDSPLHKRVMGRLNPAEQAAMDEASKDGTLSVNRGMTAASKGLGTNEALARLVSERAEPAEKRLLRIGFVLTKNQVDPTSPEQEEAIAFYQGISTQLRGEHGKDAYQAEMDRLLAYSRRSDSYTGESEDPSAEEAAEHETAEGRRFQSMFMDLRADEKMGPDGRGGGGLAAWLSETDETALQAHQAQKASRYAALFDGEISEAELQGHEALWEEFGKDHAAMLEAQEAISDAISDGMTAVTAIAFVLITLGSGSPAVAGFLSARGLNAATVRTVAVLKAMASETANIGVQKVLSGDRYGAEDAGSDVAQLLGATGGFKALSATSKWLGLGKKAPRGPAAQAKGPEASSALPERPVGMDLRNFVVRSEGFGHDLVNDKAARAYAQSASESTEAAVEGMADGSLSSARDVLEHLAKDRHASAGADPEVSSFGKLRKLDPLGRVSLTPYENDRYGIIKERAGAALRHGPIQGKLPDGTELPLTRQGLVRGQGLALQHTGAEHIPVILDHVDGLYAKLAREGAGLSQDEIVEQVAEMHWWLANAMPYERGSAAITGNFSRAILARYGIDLGPTAEGKALDLEAMVTPNVDDFKTAYASLHDGPIDMRKGRGWMGPWKRHDRVDRGG